MFIERSAATFLTLVAIAHLVRLVFRIEVLIGGIAIPLWPSGLACLMTGGFAILLWRKSER
jgi:hypothetical protein